MRIQLAERLNLVPPYAFAAISKTIARLTADGHDVIRLDAGSPDLPPPPAVIVTLQAQASREDIHGYGGYVGLPELRQAIATYYHRRFAVEVEPATQVQPLIGSKEGLVNLCLALLNPSDVVLVPSLGYPSYERGANLVGALPTVFTLNPDNNYLPALADIPADVAASAKLMWINYPHNPTGAVISLEELRPIVEFCIEHNIVLASDNPYADVVFDGSKPPSIFQIDGAETIGIEFTSMSKTFNMAGWRVGAAVGQPDLIWGLLSVKSNVDSGLFKAVQLAAVAALTAVSEDWIVARNLEYARRRDVIMQHLPSIGLSGESPRGTLYVWAQVDDGDDVGYAQRAREQAHVSLTPGSMYGPGGRGYVRFSIVQPIPRIREAMQRLESWYAKL